MVLDKLSKQELKSLFGIIDFDDRKLDTEGQEISKHGLLNIIHAIDRMEHGRVSGTIRIQGILSHYAGKTIFVEYHAIVVGDSPSSNRTTIDLFRLDVKSIKLFVSNSNWIDIQIQLANNHDYVSITVSP